MIETYPNVGDVVAGIEGASVLNDAIKTIVHGLVDVVFGVALEKFNKIGRNVTVNSRKEKEI